MEGHAHDHGAHGHAMAAVINTTMSMVTNATAMVHGMHHGMHNISMTNTTMMGMDHGMHNLSMTNVTMGMDHGMHDHMGHDVVTDPMMHHHGHGEVTDGNMVHNHGGMTHGAGHAGHDVAGHSMKMYFNTDFPIYVLFIGWQVTSPGQLAGACIAWCLLAIAYEGLKSLREYILMRQVGSQRKYLAVAGNKSGNVDDTDVRPNKIHCLMRLFNAWHILLSILQIVQTTLGMFLMLVYMTFNVWLAFSVSLGSGLGYWLFACNKRSLDQFNDGHCV